MPLTDVVQRDDYLVTVCDNVHEELHQNASAAPSPTGGLHWSIPDPVRIGTAEAFDAAFDELNQRIAHLAPHLTPI